MLKIIKHILLIFILILPLLAFSQYALLPASTQNEIYKLNEIINKSLKKYKTYSIEDTTVQLFIFYQFDIMDSISKNELADGSFLKKLIPVYEHCRPKGRHFPAKEYKDTLLSATISIYYSDEKEIALFSYHKKGFVRYKNENYHRPQYYDALVNHFWNKKNLFVFWGVYILGDINTFFIVNGQLEVFVLFNELDGLCKMFPKDEPDEHYKVLPIKEFIDKYWERFSKKNGSRLTG